MGIFNVTLRKVGGIWFLKLGRINLSFCVSRRRDVLPGWMTGRALDMSEFNEA